MFPAPWSPSDPTIRINITENIPPGQPIFKLAAKDPLTGQPILNYQKLEQGGALESLIQVSDDSDDDNDKEDYEGDE